MNKFLKLLLSVSLLIATGSANAALKVLACEPEWGALARELGGELVDVYDATNALQDPHRIEAKPSLIARARSANLLICTGAELEVGWLPILLRQSGNSAIQPGKPGNFEAAAWVRKLEIPARLDRAEGDIHPGGNPHIQLNPHNIALVADGLSKRLAEVDASHAAQYQQRQKDFALRWQAATKRWEAQAVPLKGVSIVVQHRGFPYLSDWLGLKEVAALEVKPGVEPSGSHLNEVLEQLKRQPARMVIRAAYNSERPSQWIHEHAGIPAVMLPFTVGGSEQAKDLFGLFDDTVNRLLGALK
ncbi:MAG: zinc ABC transporter solute-binding protein [Methylophilaceae bacterium]|nr:zinc ABC transporter solute-binding protein [Methylophilaceae bacterium]